jgi:hypothetical protein
MPKVRTRRLLGALAIAVGAASCAHSGSQPSRQTGQGWNDEERSLWYESTQGSRLIPYAWLVALEQPGTDRPFLEDAHIEGFRYLPRPDTRARLPVGFTLDDQDDSGLYRTRLRWKAGQGSNEPWVGMTCSACHTAEIAYGGRPIRVDGGPALADFQGFMEALNLSLSQTSSDPAKWERFAGRVLGRDGVARDGARLRRAFTRVRSWQAAQARLNRTPTRYGYGRLDAFGHIFNKVALVASPRGATPNPADAPVSYPFLWNIHQLDHVQYNSIVANDPRRAPWRGDGTFDIGALGRNTGEVIGVFADVDARPKPGRIGFASSVDINNLVALEQQLMRLEPPKWPAAFPPIDERLAAEGEALFRTNCASCHLPLRDLATRVPDRIGFFNDASMPAPKPGEEPQRNSKPGTDPWMACNAYTYRSATGVMRGLRAGYISGRRLGETDNLSDMLTAAVGGTLVGKGDEVAKAALASFAFGDRKPRVAAPPPEAALVPFGVAPRVDPRQARLDVCERETSPILGYKARPLTGIWATGPYLHNGSVPNLYQLLLPPADRVASFPIGTREFDPKNVGYSIEPTAPGNTQTFSTSDAQNNPIPGNSNAGHDYGNGKLDERGRLALIEYMKKL